MPFLDPTEMKETGTIALTIHIHFVKPAKMNASVDHQLENAQVQSFIKFWRSCLGFVPITRLDVAKKFGKLKTLMIIKKIAFFEWSIVHSMPMTASRKSYSKILVIIWLLMILFPMKLKTTST